MNPTAQFLSLANWAPLAYVVGAGGLGWFAADMGYLLRSAQRSERLKLDGQWAELEQQLRRTMKSYRPFVWFTERCLLPGSSACQLGLFLYQPGRLEVALERVDQAVRQIDRKPAFFRSVFRRATHGTHVGALASRVIILGGLGRYEEARKSADRAGQISGSNSDRNAALVSLEVNCGHIDEALALAKTVPPEHHQASSVRVTAAWAYNLKGDFVQAVEALVELSEAQRFALHPIERHQVAFWTAQTHEASGNPDKANSFYQQVAADPIPSWMQRHAASVLRDRA